MAKGCDSSWDFDYKSRVDALVDEGYAFIGRYLNHSEGVRNGLTKSEAERLSDAGIFIVALYEAEVNVVAHAYEGVMNVVLDGKSIVVTITDKGPGIPDIAKAMQEGFSTASPEVREMGFGAGMGLPNMKKNCDRLNIESTVNVGTKVTMTTYLR